MEGVAARASAPAAFGFVNAFKPAGMSSVHVGARLRRIFGRLGPKLAIGHMGTLDPQAAGVLPIALGKATRLLPLIEDRRKAYAFTLVLGRSTSTADAFGETLATAAVPADAEWQLALVAERFVGTIAQVPPMHSAVHHEGRRLYDIARTGRVVERKARTATIFSLALLAYENGVARMRVACSEGTYVRTLCEDLGAAIGVPAHMGALVREASGPFVLYESLLLDEIARDPEAAIVAPESVIAIPTIVLDARTAAEFRAGRVVPLPGGSAASNVFVRDSARRLVGVGEAIGVLLAPRKVFS